MKMRITLMATLFAVTLLVSMAPAHAALAATPEQVAMADSLFRQGDWNEAAQLYRALTAAEPNTGRHWARYGACLHNLGAYDDAARALERAEAIGHNPTVMFNLACALSRAGRADEALDWLEKAGAAGFSNLATIEADDDLVPLHAHPRWATIRTNIDRAAHPCKYDEKWRQLDFWIGDWDVQSALGGPAGSSTVEVILGQCIIFENWTGLSGMSGKSFNFIDPVTGEWRQTWVDDSGDAHEYRGEYVDGQMRYRRERPAADGHTVLYKMTFFNLAPDHVRQLGEHSDDNGQTWQTDYDLHYWRRKA